MTHTHTQRNSQDEVLGFFSIENFVREFWSESLLSFVYYESIKREIRVKPIYECRCDGRLQTKRFTRLSYTGLVVELEHLKIKTRLTNEKFASVKGECEI
jgi:hypothetical protein